MRPLSDAGEYGRTFNEARRRQGFRSQEHLDAFYRSWDHQQACAACQRVIYVPFDDGWQPAHDLCDEGHTLQEQSFAYLDRTARA